MGNKFQRKNIWLPITKKEVDKKGWDQVDIVIISGDAYVDHPSFGAAVIGRVLEHDGYRVAIIPQPNWQDDLRDFKKFGKPRLFFGITSGSMDSMVNHYTAQKRLRSNDAYTPGGESGFRPDYATSVYSSIVRKLFPDTPIILGGIEASLRRASHYDYWSDKLKPSILFESGADMIVYGMGEQPIRELARLIDDGVEIKKIKSIEQTAFISEIAEDQNSKEWETTELYSWEDTLRDKKKHAQNFTILETESNKYKSQRIIQKYSDNYLIINPPSQTPKQKDIDLIYDLPYTRLPHPKYLKRGNIPAFDMIKNSINIHRGCFGGCSFCTISAHQGKYIVSRSEKSILKEVKTLTEMDYFKGHITDVGGPSANMYNMHGKDLSVCKKCSRPSCIWPKMCKNLNIDHTFLISLYKKINNLPGVKRITIGSGIRYDLFNSSKSSQEYIQEVIKKHVSGRLKVAPEHTEDDILKIMRKPSFDSFIQFKEKFNRINKIENLKQQLIPYFISGHPGCERKHMKSLSDKIKSENIRPEQVQDFTPTPMTMATVMYYTGINPYTLKPIYVARSKQEKQSQKDSFFWYNKNKFDKKHRHNNAKHKR